MIDLHCHILPAIDDGPADVRGSLALAAAAQRDGIQIVAATPHLREDHPGVRPDELADRCTELGGEVAAAGIALSVVPGGEVDVIWAQRADPAQLRLASYGQRGSDLLLETPYGPLAPSFEASIERLWSLRYRVLLAHPERNRSFQRAPDRLAALVARGLLVQVTAGSLTSDKRRSASRALARHLVAAGLAHVLASDAHTGTGFRRPNLSAGAAAADAISPELGRWMVVDCPLAVLAGAPLTPRPG